MLFYWMGFSLRRKAHFLFVPGSKKRKYRKRSGVLGLNREAGKCRRGPATVTASDSADYVTGRDPGKAQRSDELEPGELPD